tara:strand:+ start:267 stop:461 length:195 start_codon:yes stop_codon:yes gene_type:complete
MVDQTRPEIAEVHLKNKAKNYENQKVKKALKTFYELIIHHEELINEDDKKCWEAYDLIKRKLEL